MHIYGYYASEVWGAPEDNIEVPAKVVPRFSPGKGFEEAVAENLEVVGDGASNLGVEKS